jgi:hypothetical protein
MVALYRQRFEHYGHGTPEQAIVGLGGHVFMRPNSQDAIREFRPYFDNAPVYGGGPLARDFSQMTPHRRFTGDGHRAVRDFRGTRRALPAPAF